MSQQHISGPLDVYTGNPSVFSDGAFPQNPYGAVTGQNPTSDDPYVGFLPMVQVLDYVPSAIATANIAALANVTNGTPMSLVSSSGSGITVVGSTLYIDSQPAANPTTNIATIGARAVSITGVSSGAGGAFIVSGLDIYGNTMTQSVTVAAGANTVNTLKAFKAVTSVVPQFTDAHNYSVGTGDVYGFPLYTARFQDVFVYWNSSLISLSTGYTAGVTTSPNTNLLGDVRGTYATQSASDGTKRLTAYQAFRGYTNPNMLGVTPV